jgi:hypothetical protein
LQEELTAAFIFKARVTPGGSKATVSQRPDGSCVRDFIHVTDLDWIPQYDDLGTIAAHALA